MSKPPWAKDEFPECSTADFLSAVHIAREGVVLSRRYESVKNAARESEFEPHFQSLRQVFYGVISEQEHEDDEPPNLIHSEAAVRFCERVGRVWVQRGLLTALIGRFLLQEYRNRFGTNESDVDFYDACNELSLAAETHLHFLALVEDPDQRIQAIQKVDQVIESQTLPQRVEILRDAFGQPLTLKSRARRLCERLVALSVAARYLQYIEGATHKSPNSAMRKPLDRETYSRLRVVTRGGGDDVLMSLITAVNITQNLRYEDLRSKSPLAEKAIEDAAGYLRNTDEFLNKRLITNMRMVLQAQLQKRRKDGVNIVAERFAQLYRITSPDFISWNLSKVDLQKYYKIIKAARDPEPVEPATV